MVAPSGTTMRDMIVCWASTFQVEPASSIERPSHRSCSRPSIVRSSSSTSAHARPTSLGTSQAWSLRYWRPSSTWNAARSPQRIDR